MRTICLALACLAGGTALAEADASRQPSAPRAIDTRLPHADTVFVSDAGIANLGTVAMAELAVERGAPEIRAVARMIHDDGQHVREQLRLLARRRGFTLPEQLRPAQRIAYERLRTLSGKAFDKAYLAEVQAEEQVALSLFRDEAEHGSDDELRGFARTMLTSLRIGELTAGNALQRL
jgi:putative membrane protein